ncbi:hypothetical protein TruAng_003289 [Truncatella angustata]|nr:hypothetical protein TruAng_003289 [Truncatella angustata]
MKSARRTHGTADWDETTSCATSPRNWLIQANLITATGRRFRLGLGLAFGLRSLPSLCISHFALSLLFPSLLRLGEPLGAGANWLALWLALNQAAVIDSGGMWDAPEITAVDGALSFLKDHPYFCSERKHQKRLQQQHQQQAPAQASPAQPTSCASASKVQDKNGHFGMNGKRKQQEQRDYTRPGPELFVSRIFAQAMRADVGAEAGATRRFSFSVVSPHPTANLNAAALWQSDRTAWSAAVPVCCAPHHVSSVPQAVSPLGASLFAFPPSNLLLNPVSHTHSSPCLLSVSFVAGLWCLFSTPSPVKTNCHRPAFDAGADRHDIAQPPLVKRADEPATSSNDRHRKHSLFCFWISAPSLA